MRCSPQPRGTYLLPMYLSSETVLRVNRRILHSLTLLRPLAPGEQPRRLTRVEVEEVIAEKEAVVQARYEAYQQRYFLPLERNASALTRVHHHIRRMKRRVTRFMYAS
jgi:hypothetical protein